MAKRSEKRKEAAEQFEAAKEIGDIALADKLVRRNVKVTAKHNDDCKRLLSLMGVPWIQAPGEAEAQCAALVQAGLVYAAGSEDMDTLTFGANVLLRHLTFSEAKKLPISELHLEKVLEGLEMSIPQFIDLCILLGCDYCESIRGIGPHKAVALLKQHGSIESVLETIDRLKYPIPENWPYEEVRRLFSHPAILPPDDPQLAATLKWGMPDESGLVEFMVRQNGFSEVRVKTAIDKIAKARRTAPQGRLDGYFKVLQPSTKQTVVAFYELYFRKPKTTWAVKPVARPAARQAKQSLAPKVASSLTASRLQKRPKLHGNNKHTLLFSSKSHCLPLRLCRRQPSRECRGRRRKSRRWWSWPYGTRCVRRSSGACLTGVAGGQPRRGSRRQDGLQDPGQAGAAGGQSRGCSPVDATCRQVQGQHRD